MITLLTHGAGNRHDGSHRKAAGDADNGAILIDVGRQPEWTDEIRDGVACFQMCHAVGGRADRHNDDGNRSLFAVPVGNSQRDAFALLVNPDNYELTGLGSFGNAGCFYLVQVDIRCQVLLKDNFEQL